MAAAPGRFLSSGTKWRPQAEPGGAAFPLPLGYLEICGLCAPSRADQGARLPCGRVAGAAGILTWDPGTVCERGRPRASAGGTRPAAGPGRWRGTSEADESGARPPGGEEVCRPCCGMPRSGEAESESLSLCGPWQLRRCQPRDLWWRRRVGRRPPSCGRTKGRPGGGASRPVLGPR